MRKIRDFMNAGGVEVEAGGGPVAWMKRKSLAVLLAIGLSASALAFAPVAACEEKTHVSARKGQAELRRASWGDYCVGLGLQTTPDTLRSETPEYPEYTTAMIALRANIIAMVASARDESNAEKGKKVACDTILESFRFARKCAEEDRQDKFLAARGRNYGEYLLEAVSRLEGLYRINEQAPILPPIGMLDNPKIVELGDLLFAMTRPTVRKFHDSCEALRLAGGVMGNPGVLPEKLPSRMALGIRHQLNLAAKAHNRVFPGLPWKNPRAILLPHRDLVPVQK